MFRMNASLIAKRASAAVTCRAAGSAAVRRPAFVNMLAMSRSYSASASGLNQKDVEDRIIKVFRAFDKIEDASKITPTANFSTELGLDSLDTVEVIVAVEEEFGIEIPE
ncbi:Acp1p [Sugiyamaella lignohabitans]|uniref:Acyl carrier protein n=1 Tax=Sugiyamaella lignohabitans TaxID=796027 RepID=A0A167F1K8_9ASCO|nr:Acp1p [Sugiyamaella lignohabitans]ANB14709.1 Acp1p [Sugiyamaella lignohabitans]